jgi:hypothetical protein
MKDETEIAVFEKFSAEHKLGNFKVRRNAKESDAKHTWWDVGPLDNRGCLFGAASLVDTFFIVEDHGDCGSFELFVWVHHRGNRDEPPSSEEKSLGVFSSLGGALEGILVSTLREVIQEAREEIMEKEMEKEL